MKFKTIAPIMMIALSITQFRTMLPVSHNVNIGSGRPIGVEVIPGGVSMYGSGGENNRMYVGPHQGCKGFHMCGKDTFNMKGTFNYVHWFEIDPVATDENKKHPRIRHCEAKLENNIADHSDIYFQENCIVYVVEHTNEGPVRNDMLILSKKPEATGSLYYTNQPLEPALSVFQKRGESPKLTPEQEEMEKKLLAAGWKKGPLGQLVPPSIGQAIQKATKK